MVLFVFMELFNSMGKVILLPTKNRIPPKSETFEHAGQRYTCVFDPNAPPGERWVWLVDYVRTYRYYGSSPSLEAAAIAARKRIHMCNQRIVQQEESGA